jgi:ABC-type uncharacterized transport system substrate-binding protein
MRLLGAVIVVALSVGATSAARAHPHVFVDAGVGVSFGQRGLDSGGFTPSAVKELEQHVRGLEPLGFLVDIRVNAAAVPVTGLRDFQAPIEGDRVMCVFTVAVSPPASTEGVVQINVDDPGLYTAFALVEPVRVEASGPYQVECRVARDVLTKRPEGVRCEYRRRAP